MAHLAAFFGDAIFFEADFGFDGFLAAAGFLAPADFGFFDVVAFLTFGLAAFFVDEAFLAPAGLLPVDFFALDCLGLCVLAALADLGVALERGLADLAILTFFGLTGVAVAEATVVVVDDGATGVVAELFMLAAVATFLAGFDPADFERARFFVPDEALFDDDDGFFDLVDLFFVDLGSPVDANLNEPLAPLPLVCLKYFALTPFLRANLRC
jgi:hypothetical protein